MRKRMLLLAALVCLVPAAASAQIVAFFEDFESLEADSLDALYPVFVVYGNVYQAGTGNYLYGYGPFPAPNNPASPAFCTITLGEGGDEQGAQQLAVFSDYNNAGAHVAGDLVEANVYKEFTIDPTDVGKTWVFEFQAKKGLLVAPSTAKAFIKTLDPLNGYVTTNLITEDMTAIPDTWGGWSMSLSIDAGLIGQLFQVGFSNECTNYDPSSILYDNLQLREALSDVPVASAIADANLKQNYPNPFNPMTRIDFSLEKAGRVDLSVYDMAGRLVANLLSGDLGTGDHFVNWNGTDRNGAAAAAGVYNYVLRTGAGQVSRSMILLK
ncbi:T9SS type A sorting domain-containing protein [bacterium]|nr:T9SS type A sorting domain-containing protein [bacterium]